MRKRDLGILLISALAIFFSLQNEGNFSFKEGWFHYLEESYPLKHEGERLPPPIVTDLNGDGQNEVIVATHDAKLQVLDPLYRITNEGFGEARILAEVSLLPERVRVAAGRRPVAMAAGALRRPFYEKDKGKQVLVVVTAGWVIMCFDHNLKKLWEANVQEDFPHGAHHKEVAISISNYTLKHGDTGLVIVGGSMEIQPQVHLDPFEEELVLEKEAERHRHSASANEDIEDIEVGVVKARHFSYYAYAGSTGNLRWSHKSGDFLRDASSSLKLIPQHNYRLDASHLDGRHYGEVECREFRESILGVMPHRWERREDTRFELANFQKHKRNTHKRIASSKNSLPSHKPTEKVSPGRDSKNKVASAIKKAAEYATSSKAQKRYPFGSVITNHTSSWWIPNVVVAHLKEGIEAVHLASGRTICKLWLQEGGLHADINGDGVLDHVQAAGSHGAESFVANGMLEAMKPCWAVATSGVPVKEQLFNGSVCRHSPFSSFQHADFGHRIFRRGMNVAPTEIIAPILMPRHDGHRHRKGSFGDVIFLTSRGEVTAFSVESAHAHEGIQRWQIVTGASWSTHPSLSGLTFDKVVPTLMALPLRKYGSPSVILAAGEHEAVIISAGGSQLSSFALPSATTHSIIAVDFTGDGYNDLLVCTGNGIYGFVQTQHSGAVLFSSLVGCLIVVMAVIFVTHYLNAPKGKPRPLSRSTD
ncbi:hypothetical protein O6H91_23G017300 [Diphasiastrum complanatum]|uniref:Uncharacterized protein n=3 Tax=Diphasiastrum complanatum TaxID=34168 RepID=A0ACC2A8I3_DIPCM|nr:hypothetical protein O6H91_23G017300 [Diphasiastrum complanatum]KAJ7513866.1 hypothetical protein O6H91_23G017300 [Diphasiastrum complanatum]KAJ7513867.1 hypothetical protein O6H91_23G017300 [Diphasiastrum complanatum]